MGTDAAASVKRRADSYCRAAVPDELMLSRRCSNPFVEVIDGKGYCGVHANVIRNRKRKAVMEASRERKKRSA